MEIKMQLLKSAKILELKVLTEPLMGVMKIQVCLMEQLWMTLQVSKIQSVILQ